MNFHPLIVHFPIAFLTIYTLLEFVRIKRVQEFGFWFYIKAALVFIGSASTVPALFSGKLIENGFEDRANLVNAHSFWAELTTMIFGLIALSYFVEIINKHNIFNIAQNTSFSPVWKLVLKIKKMILETKLIIVLTFLGLLAVVVTGSLGGIIVYGQNLDPFTEFIYKLLIAH